METGTLITKHIDPLHCPPFDASVKYFLEKGSVSGSFHTALTIMMHDAIRLSNEENIVINIDELKKDNSPGSLYYAWQSNIAMAFHDQFANDFEGVLSQRQLSEVANKAACRFLDQILNSKDAGK